MDEKIRAVFVFEILGRPPEHVKSSLEEFVNKLEEIKGIKILNKTIHEPHLIEEEDSKDLYTTFAEVELEIDNLSLLFSVIFNRLPSNIEVIQPAEIRLKNFDLSSILSELAVKMHSYDEIAKGLALERNIFMGKFQEAEEKIKILERERNAAMGNIMVKVKADLVNEIKTEYKKESKSVKKKKV